MSQHRNSCVFILDKHHSLDEMSLQLYHLDRLKFLIQEKNVVGNKQNIYRMFYFFPFLLK